MLLVEENARKELNAARKILYEGDDRTRKTFISLLIVLVSPSLIPLIIDCPSSSLHFELLRNFRRLGV